MIVGTNKLLMLLLPVVVLTVLFVAFFSNKANRSKQPVQSSINSFQECVEAGNPIMESYPRQCRTEDGKLFVEEIDEVDQPFENGTPTPFDENWQTHTNEDVGISFPYPSDYQLSDGITDTSKVFMSLMSPPDPNKPEKQTTLGENELKIEIVTEDSVENDSSEKCYFDHTEDPNILDQREIEVAGTTAVQFDWQGHGRGQFVCVIKNDTRYIINKYPLETSLQSDYEIFLENLTIK